MGYPAQKCCIGQWLSKWSAFLLLLSWGLLTSTSGSRATGLSSLYSRLALLGWRLLSSSWGGLGLLGWRLLSSSLGSLGGLALLGWRLLSSSSGWGGLGLLGWRLLSSRLALLGWRLLSSSGWGGLGLLGWRLLSSRLALLGWRLLSSSSWGGLSLLAWRLLSSRLALLGWRLLSSSSWGGLGLLGWRLLSSSLGSLALLGSLLSSSWRPVAQPHLVNGVLHPAPVVHISMQQTEVPVCPHRSCMVALHAALGCCFSHAQLHCQQSTHPVLPALTWSPVSFPQVPEALPPHPLSWASSQKQSYPAQNWQWTRLPSPKLWMNMAIQPKDETYQGLSSPNMCFIYKQHDCFVGAIQPWRLMNADQEL